MVEIFRGRNLQIRENGEKTDLCPCLLLLLLLLLLPRRLILRLFWAIPSRGMALKKSCPNWCPVKFSAGIVFIPAEILVKLRFTVVSWGKITFLSDAIFSKGGIKCPIKTENFKLGLYVSVCEVSVVKTENSKLRLTYRDTS